MRIEEHCTLLVQNIQNYFYNFNKNILCQTFTSCWAVGKKYFCVATCVTNSNSIQRFYLPWHQWFPHRNCHVNIFAFTCIESSISKYGLVLHSFHYEIDNNTVPFFWMLCEIFTTISQLRCLVSNEAERQMRESVSFLGLQCFCGPLRQTW